MSTIRLLFIILACATIPAVGLNVTGMYQATTPKDVATFDSGSTLMKRFPIASLRPQIADSSVNAHKADTATHVPRQDSVRAAFKADSARKADSSSVAGTAYGFVHGVPAGTLLKAKSTTECTLSHITENGDTTKVTYTSAVSDTFYNSALTSTTMRTGCRAPNGDCYFFADNGVGNGDVFIQYGGSGGLVDLLQTHRNWYGSATVSTGDIFACVFGASRENIYKRTGGAGNFTSIGCSGYWYDMASYDDTLYGLNADTSGSLVMIFPATSSMASVGISPDYQYTKLSIDKNGNFFMIRSGTYDLYCVYKGTTTAVPLGFPARSYTAIGRDSSNTMFVTSGNYVYRQIGGSGALSLFQNLAAPSYDFFYKSNGDVYNLRSTRINIKSNENLKCVFNVIAGGADFDGKVTIDNAPLTTTARFVLANNAEPDHEVKRAVISSLDVDSARVSGSSDTADTAYGADRLDGFHKSYYDTTGHGVIQLQISSMSLGMDSCRMYDGATDTLFIYKSGKRWEYLPVADK